MHLFEQTSMNCFPEQKTQMDCASLCWANLYWCLKPDEKGKWNPAPSLPNLPTGQIL